MVDVTVEGIDAGLAGWSWMSYGEIKMGSASKDMGVGSVAYGKDILRTYDHGNGSMIGTSAEGIVCADVHRPCRRITPTTVFSTPPLHTHHLIISSLLCDAVPTPECGIL